MRGACRSTGEVTTGYRDGSSALMRCSIRSSLVAMVGSAQSTSTVYGILLVLQGRGHSTVH